MVRALGWMTFNRSCSHLGERRIRVLTLALPTTTSLSELYASADQIAITTFFANKAVERSLTHKMEDSREYVFQKLVEVLVAYKTSMTSSGAGASAQLAIAENLKMLPVLVLGLLKNVGLSVIFPIRTSFITHLRLAFVKAHKYPLISVPIHRLF